MRKTYRYGIIWRVFAVAIGFFAVALELLIANEDHGFDWQGIATCAAVVCCAAWWYLYVARYAVTIDDEGLTVERFWRQPIRAAWRDIVRVSMRSEYLVFATNTGHSLKVSTNFPAFSAIENALAQNVPEVAYPPGSPKPFVEPPSIDPRVNQARHEVMRRLWLNVSRRLAYTSAACLLLGWISGAVLPHVHFRALPAVLQAVALVLLAFTNSFGYGFGWCLAGISVLALIMYAQEVYRFRKGLPPAE